MKTTIFYKVRKLAKGFLPFYLFTLLPLITSCSDFLQQDSNRVQYADRHQLDDASDTIYSAAGILGQLQTLADRTILLGEVRGDLVALTSFASADLREVANFCVSDNNRYNRPADYYAVINNCNYFIAHADTALRNLRNERLFEKEYAAVKAWRAWTYLQLAMVYGRVPFVTEPILSQTQSEQQFPMYDILQVCRYFIDDLRPYVNTPLPGYGSIRTGEDSRFYYFPVSLLLGELNLWAGNYREAAEHYYEYISRRNGMNTAYPAGNLSVTWPRDDTDYRRVYDSWSSACFATESFSSASELIMMLPGDDKPTEGNYSQLRNLFNATTDNDGYYAITPSQAMIALSASQTYCNRTTTGDVNYPPHELNQMRGGDLRLSAVWQTGTLRAGQPADMPVPQTLHKYTTQNVHLWRRAMVYLHMAEAFNRAGLPHLAWHFLATGVNDRVMAAMQHEYPADSLWLTRFSFPTADYVLRAESTLGGQTTLGIHSRGSGFTEWNATYQMPVDSTLSGTALTNWQMELVENMIVEEEALELAFEGQRYYDLMRVALRRNDPSYLARRIARRHGSAADSGVKADLTNPANWYLKIEQ